MSSHSTPDTSSENDRSVSAPSEGPPTTWNDVDHVALPCVMSLLTLEDHAVAGVNRNFRSEWLQNLQRRHLCLGRVFTHATHQVVTIVSLDRRHIIIQRDRGEDEIGQRRAVVTRDLGTLQPADAVDIDGAVDVDIKHVMSACAGNGKVYVASDFAIVCFDSDYPTGSSLPLARHRSHDHPIVDIALVDHPNHNPAPVIIALRLFCFGLEDAFAPLVVLDATCLEFVRELHVPHEHVLRRCPKGMDNTLPLSGLACVRDTVVVGDPGNKRLILLNARGQLIKIVTNFYLDAQTPICNFSFLPLGNNLLLVAVAHGDNHLDRSARSALVELQVEAHRVMEQREAVRIVREEPVDGCILTMCRTSDGNSVVLSRTKFDSSNSACQTEQRPEHQLVLYSLWRQTPG